MSVQEIVNVFSFQHPNYRQHGFIVPARHTHAQYNTKRGTFHDLFTRGKEKANVSPTKKNRGEFALVPNAHIV